MSVTIEVFYSFQSPYSYLALEPTYSLEERFDVQLLWQVFSAKGAGQTVTPSPVVPEKLMYMFEDTKRYAAEFNIPLVYPEKWPEDEFDPGRACRGALIAADLGVLKEYNFKLFHHWWGLGLNPNDETFMNELCDDLDIDLGDFLSKMSSTDTRERVKGLYKRGKKLGVFDTPTFIIGEERFVGLDKLMYLERYLEKRGHKKVAKA